MTLQTVVEVGDSREGEEDPLWHTAGSRQPQAKRTARLDALPAPKAPGQAPPAIGAASSSHGLMPKRPAGGKPPATWQ
jgi:hypothetical protein